MSFWGLSFWSPGFWSSGFWTEQELQRRVVLRFQSRATTVIELTSKVWM